ncbi:MAG: S8 family serine peptidase [Geminicoccaceae bacterium]
MTWALAILDDGITNQAQAAAGKITSFEHDFYDGSADTDQGVDTHGDLVFQSALRVSRSYAVVDLKIADPVSEAYPDGPIEQSLQYLIAHPELHVAAVNMSFGGGYYPYAYAGEIATLAARGVLTVAAAGNYGDEFSLEDPLYPAALANVITVGSHDGAGNPSWFSQNGRAIDILADGEDVPSAGIDGTSFSTPQVTATVTHVQAIVYGLAGHLLNATQMVDALQLGGAGPRSNPDPADGHTRYFLLDFQGSLDYAWGHYGGSATRALEYIASYGDLSAAFGANAAAGQRHFERNGSVEERAITFDALAYTASYGDLITAYGANEQASATHYLTAGLREGRTVGFDGLDYIASYRDLIGALGADAHAGALHFVTAGAREGRSTSFDGLDYIASYDDLVPAFGASEDAGATHFITSGASEGRATSFDGLQYIASWDDLITAYGANERAGALHFIDNGFAEHRARDTFDAEQYLANYADLRAAFGDDTEAATIHYIQHGHAEHRTDDPIGATDFLL